MPESRRSELDEGERALIGRAGRGEQLIAAGSVGRAAAENLPLGTEGGGVHKPPPVELMERRLGAEPHARQVVQTAF